jgi:uncharacterized protein with HEPN domain
MKATLADRLSHIQVAIGNIDDLTSAFADHEISSNAVRRAALERFFEIISEASRYIPDHKRDEHPEIPWRRVTGIGNILRHGYDSVTFETLLLIARTEIHDLARAIQLIIEADQPSG